MEKLRLVSLLLILALVMTACGRRLPDPEEIARMTAQAPTVVPTDVQSEEPDPGDEVTEIAPTVPSTDEDEAAVDPTEELIADGAPVGDAVLGQQIFSQPLVTSSGSWMCASCHSVDEARTRLVGPGLYGLIDLAEERIEDAPSDTALDYIYNSIVNPQAYIVPADAGGAYVENLMPQNYGEVLSEDELNALVAYIASLQP